MITPRAAGALAGFGLALALTGCSSTDTADANAAWCEGAATVQTEVDKMATLIENGSSTDLVKTQWNAVEAAIEANSVALSQLEDSAKQDVSAAYDSFTAAVGAIPSDLPPSEAAAQYKAAVDAFTTDMQSVSAEVGCS